MLALLFFRVSLRRALDFVKRQVQLSYVLLLPQEESSTLRIVEQQDPSSLAAAEALQSPAPQVLDQKEELSKKETVDEEWATLPEFGSGCFSFSK